VARHGEGRWHPALLSHACPLGFLHLLCQLGRSCESPWGTRSSPATAPHPAVARLPEQRGSRFPPAPSKGLLKFSCSLSPAGLQVVSGPFLHLGPSLLYLHGLRSCVHGVGDAGRHHPRGSTPCPTSSVRRCVYFSKALLRLRNPPAATKQACCMGTSPFVTKAINLKLQQEPCWCQLLRLLELSTRQPLQREQPAWQTGQAAQPAAGRSGKLREGDANPAVNSPAPSHLATAPFKGKPRRQQSLSRKDVVPPHVARDTSSSRRNTLLPALAAAEPLESGQPWCRALPNVFKPPCLPSRTLVKSFEGPQGSPGWAVPLQGSSTARAVAFPPITTSSKSLELFQRLSEPPPSSACLPYQMAMGTGGAGAPSLHPAC